MAPTDGFDEETTLGDILSAGPQPTIEKGVTKSPTRKALQQAAQRKEAALRRVLAAQTRRGYAAALDPGLTPCVCESLPM